MKEIEHKMQQIGRRVRKARQAKGWTMRELEREAKISNGWLCRIEPGTAANPGLKLLIMVAIALEVPLSQLMPDTL